MNTRPVGRPLKRDPDMIKLIMALTRQSLSSRKIVKALEIHGYNIGYVTVTKIIKEERIKST